MALVIPVPVPADALLQYAHVSDAETKLAIHEELARNMQEVYGVDIYRMDQKQLRALFRRKHKSRWWSKLLWLLAVQSSSRMVAPSIAYLAWKAAVYATYSATFSAFGAKA